MRYVEIDRTTGEVTWDKYFDYLRTVEDQFAPSLRNYVMQWEHYSLDGGNSLHDSWLTAVRFGGSNEGLILEFLGARHDRRHVLRYVDVTAYAFDLSVQFRTGDRDVFVHEFRIDDSLVTHEVLFSNQGRIVITARTISPEIGLPLSFTH